MLPEQVLGLAVCEWYTNAQQSNEYKDKIITVKMVGIIVTQHSLTTLPSLKGFNASASERAK